MSESRHLRVVAGGADERPLTPAELRRVVRLFELLEQIDRRVRAHGDQFRTETATARRR